MKRFIRLTSAEDATTALVDVDDVLWVDTQVQDKHLMCRCRVALANRVTWYAKESIDEIQAQLDAAAGKTRLEDSLP